MKKSTPTIAAVLMFSLLLGACGSGQTPAASSAEAAETVEETAAAAVESVEETAAAVESVEETAAAPDETAAETEAEPVAPKPANFREPEEIMKDLESLDRYHEMNTEGLHMEKEEDAESSTAILNWYDAEEHLIYRDYEGYGEDSFTWITTLPDGTGAEVLYAKEGPGFDSVTVQTADYGVNLYRLDPELPYGAAEVAVVQRRENGWLLSDYRRSEFVDGQWIDTARGQYTDEGFVEDFYYIEEGELQTWQSVRAQRRDVPEQVGIPDGVQPQEDGSYAMQVGNHRLYYPDSPEGTWYVTVHLITAMEEDSDSYDTVEADLPIAAGCKGVDVLTWNEYDEYYRRSMILNEKGEIAEIR